jgi:hypothetical protein
MHNIKAFLEGLIVNEVLTKTASFEKLAFSPLYIYAVNKALRDVLPGIDDVPPFVPTNPPALPVAYYALRRWMESQKRSPVNEEANSRRSGLDAHSQPPTGVGNNVGRGVPKGTHPTKEEAVEIAKRLLLKP